MSELVERLRAWHKGGETITGDVQLYLDAADEIERLRERLVKAKDALRRIATDSYTRADEEARWDHPLMIWQSVARGTLEFELSDDQSIQS